MPTKKPVIRFSKVKKCYISDFKRNRKTALSDLSFQVDESEVFGIIGPNGAGKSTALKILMGFIKKDSGEVLLAEHYTAPPSTHEKVGYLPENPCLYDNLSVREHLQFASRVARFTKEQTAARTEEIIRTVNLSDAADIPIRRYSKGMTQRAALAYALIHEPEILVLDEPMSGLDPLGRQLVVDLIRDYNAKGNTILFCSHVLTDVERICNRIGIMNKGRIVEIITPGELNGMSAAREHLPGNSPLEAHFIQAIAKDNDTTNPGMA